MLKNQDGSRAIGTRVSEEVYNQVVVNGQPYIGRAYVVNNWYITAYEPIKNNDNQIIGILICWHTRTKICRYQAPDLVYFPGNHPPGCTSIHGPGILSFPKGFRSLSINWCLHPEILPTATWKQGWISIPMMN